MEVDFFFFYMVRQARLQKLNISVKKIAFVNKVKKNHEQFFRHIEILILSIPRGNH